MLRDKGLVTRMLVIAPLRAAHAVWPAEAAKWECFQGLKVVVLHGPKKNALLSSDFDVAVINPEGLGWLFAGMGMDWPFEVLVIDESTMFKNSRTLRFKTLRPHLNKFRRRYILTGTPSPNGLIDLFGQVYILDGGNALGARVTQYRLEYFDSTGYGGYTYTLKPGAEERIYEKLAPLMLRMDSKDYLELPDLIENDVPVLLPPTARRAYDTMEATLIAALEEGTVVAANAATAMGKCRQMASGGVYEGPEVSHHLHDAKLDALTEVVESLQGKPALVAYEFDHERRAIQKRYPKAPHIGGGVSTRTFREVEARWNMGAIPVLLVQPQSAAHGLNLQAGGSTVVWYTLPWARDIYDQLNARLHRQGQKEKVFVHRLIARDTVDEAVVRALRTKGKNQAALLAALKEYARENG